MEKDVVVEQINKLLHVGSRKNGVTLRIAQKARCSRNTVCAVLRGEWKNEKVINAALEEIETREKEKNQIQERLNKLNKLNSNTHDAVADVGKSPQPLF
jgi:lambda repressor-like predicted transcriptional regulator